MKAQRWLTPLLLSLGMIVTLFGQTPRPTFDVASIKKIAQPVTSQVLSVTPPIRGGTVTLHNSTVASLMQFAYSLRDFQVVSGPEWIKKDLFEVHAKSAGEPARTDVLLMLQSLLEERFRLVTHKEQRDMRFFEMVVARSDGRLGPYLHRGPDTPQPCDRKQIEERESGRPKPTPGMAMSTVGIRCGPLTTLAEIASQFVGLPVFDRTELTGRWSATLYFLPAPRPGVTPDPSIVSFPTALQEQLGLKLEPTRGPVDVMVIDSVQQPTEN